ncbi:hypothetical protein [Pseudomonas japonica]|uniref:hypothetical protein n=1 Tax=Pseudomonas japonica TaxID=256466 RepID=UPI0015E29D16|nr:hypothetical protein [Pseudomonas japonica]MBA1290996.1 hypothetical protein [Pseudomonas japonica]
MTRTLLSALALCAATVVAAPAFAADDLCAANLQKIDDTMTTNTATNPALEKTMRGQIDAAKADQARGDTKACIASTGKILTQLDNYTKKGGAAGN